MNLMNIEPAFKAAFQGPAIAGLQVHDHALDVLPMAIVHEDGVTVAEGQIAHRTEAGAVDRLHFQLEVKHHRLVGSKRRLESESSTLAVARVASPWLGSAEFLIASIAQRLAADPDFDRIEIAFPQVEEVQ